MLLLTPGDIHPFVRCVGLGNGVSQGRMHAAYDNRLILALSGDGCVKWEAAVDTMAAGDIFLIAPGTPYQVCSQPGQQIIVVNFDWTQHNAHLFKPILSVVWDDFQAERITEQVDWSCLFPKEDHLCLTSSPEGQDLAWQLLELYLAPRTEWKAQRMAVSGVMLQMLAVLLDHRSGRSKAAQEIFDYICKNCTLPLSLQSVAQKFHYHPSYINRLLNASYNTSFRQLLIRRRLMEGVNLLENTSMTVREIAWKVGFYDQAHFIDSFRRHYGKTPAQYR